MTCKPQVQLYSVRHKMITMRDKYDGGQWLCLLLAAVKASPGSSRDWPKPDRRLLKLWTIPSASFQHPLREENRRKSLQINCIDLQKTSEAELEAGEDACTALVATAARWCGSVRGNCISLPDLD